MIGALLDKYAFYYILKLKKGRILCDLRVGESLTFSKNLCLAQVLLNKTGGSIQILPADPFQR